MRLSLRAILLLSFVALPTSTSFAQDGRRYYQPVVPKPYDLALTEFRFDPVRIGQMPTLTVTVECVSAEMRSQPTWLFFYLADEQHTLLGWVSVPPLTPGSQWTRKLTWYHYAEDRAYLLHAILGWYGDTDRNNNYLTAGFYPTRNSFDLAAQRIELATIPELGTYIVVRVFVECMEGTSRDARPQVALYDLRPHPVYRSHSLTARKTQELARRDIPPLSKGDVWEVILWFLAEDQYYNLHAQIENVEGLDTNAENNVVNSRGVQFRPLGGTDVVIEGCHVIYRRAHGVTLSDQQIEQLKQYAREYADFLWVYTRCLRVSFTTEIFDQAPQSTPTDTSAHNGYVLLPENIRNDLKGRKIDISGEWFAGSDWRRYGFYIVNSPMPDRLANMPRPDMGKPPIGGWGIWHQDGPQGGSLYQWQYVNFAQPNLDYFLHEGMHGLEANFGRPRGWEREGWWWRWNSSPVHKFPATHHDASKDGLYTPEYSEMAPQLHSGAANATREYGDPYWVWMLETTPTSWWFDLTMGDKGQPHDHYSTTYWP